MMLKQEMKRWTSVCLVIIMCSLTFLNAGSISRAEASDMFDELREKYTEMLTGGASYSLSDPDIAARVASITDDAQTLWTSMKKDAGRVRLWDNAPLGNDSASITTSYRQLAAMALAYRTYGSSLMGDSDLRDDIIDGLDWMNTFQHGFYEGCSMYQNWWHWQIGGPLALNEVVALMYDELTQTQIDSYMAAINYAQPSVNMTGANRLWESQVIALAGINGKDGDKIAHARDGLSALLTYVAQGDGFYEDGSFVQHSYYSYNGGYGLDLLKGIADLTYLLHDSTWEVVDPNKQNIFNWVYDSFEPFIYKGNLMDMVRGREISRHARQSAVVGVEAVAAILRLSHVAPPADAAAFKSMVKHWLQEGGGSQFLQQASITHILSAQAILNDVGIVPRGELEAYRQFAGMDRALQLRQGYGFGISMFSSRIGGHEAINAENNKGWHTGAGMTYLYNNDLDQFNDHFWPTVDSYRLPGTTVLHETPQAANTRGDKSWAGGTDMLGLYGVTGMEYHAIGKSLTAKKSWFMFDDEIVALGTDITSGDGVAVETIVENRKLNGAGDDALTVNGSAKPATLGWSETMSAISYAHLGGGIAGSDIGYYFPDGATLHALREARTGNWRQINSAQGSPNTPHTRNYLTMWLEHGVNPSNGAYSYVLLPNKTSAGTASYASSPDITIIENSSSAQAVKENGLQITGINFWNDERKTVAGVTSNAKASVMTRETASELNVSVSDPTQSNVGMIYIEIDKSATGLIAKDDAVTVLQYSPTIKFKVDVNKAGGRSFKAAFSLTGAQQPNPAPIPIPNPYEAETLPISATTKSATLYNDGNASGGQKLGLNSSVIGDYTEFSLDVTQPGTYDIVAKIMKVSNNGIFQFSINGESVGEPVDMYWNTSESAQSFSPGSYTFNAPGSYLLRLTVTGKHPNASGYKLMLDHFTLEEVPVSLPNPYEAETLPIHHRTQTVTIYNDSNTSGGQRLGLNHKVVGDYTEFILDVPQAGTYEITARVLKFSDNGIYQFSIDGNPVGDPIDTYWNTAGYIRDFTPGSYTFSAPGNYLLRLTATGKNPSASGLKIMLDYIWLD